MVFKVYTYRVFHPPKPLRMGTMSNELEDTWIHYNALTSRLEDRQADLKDNIRGGGNSKGGIVFLFFSCGPRPRKGHFAKMW